MRNIIDRLIHDRYLLVNRILINIPEFLILDPVLVVVHEVGKPLPHLRDLLLDSQKPKWGNTSVVIIGILEVFEFNLIMKFSC